MMTRVYINRRLSAVCASLREAQEIVEKTVVSLYTFDTSRPNALYYRGLDERGRDVSVRVVRPS